MKKLVTVFLSIALIFNLSIPVFARQVTDLSTQKQMTYTSSYFSGSTGTMNSFNGNDSRSFNISSGSISNEAITTSVKLNITVSSGSKPFYIVVKDPNGNMFYYGVSKSGSITLNDFNGENARGTWNVSITGSSYVSTATARMTVNYSY